MARKSNILVARVSYFVVIDGQRLAVHRGRTTAHANHPVVRGNEDKWRAVTVDYAVDEKPPEKKEDKPAYSPPAKKAAPKKQAESKQENNPADTGKESV